MNRIIFLDFDGVVNNCVWYKNLDGEIEYGYAHPSTKMVNDFQSICFLNEIYEKYPYDIVLTTSWREVDTFDNVCQCLYNGGLNKDIKVIGMVDIPPTGFFSSPAYERNVLISQWLDEHDFKGTYLIFDDDDYYLNDDRLCSHFIWTRDPEGIDWDRKETALRKIRAFENIVSDDD